MSRLLLPAFAFLTFYSLNVIVFAAIYRIIDKLSALPQFVIDGTAQPISFPDALYFSVITVSTVGYGDIAPHGSLVQVIAAVQIVLGVVLLLFGFREIVHYSEDDRR